MASTGGNRFDQQFNLALIAKSRKHVAASRGIRPGEQKSAGGHEGAFQSQIVLPQHRRVNFWRRG